MHWRFGNFSHLPLLCTLWHRLFPIFIKTIACHRGCGAALWTLLALHVCVPETLTFPQLTEESEISQLGRSLKTAFHTYKVTGNSLAGFVKYPPPIWKCSAEALQEQKLEGWGDEATNMTSYKCYCLHLYITTTVCRENSHCLCSHIQLRWLSDKSRISGQGNQIQNRSVSFAL